MTIDQPSDKPLFEKLGFNPGDSVFVETTPAWYGELAEAGGIELSPDITAKHAHLFCSSKRELMAFLKDYDINDVEQSVWFSWPKQAAKAKTDLTEQALRDTILPLGWVDVKVAAIDDTWSGLKFVRRQHKQVN
jgi:hypothetical protein